RMAPLPLHPMFAAPFDAVIDCTRLEGLTPTAFELISRHIGEVSGLSDRIRRVAIARPSNMTGATLAGLFYELVSPRFRAGLFTDTVEGYHWLGRQNVDEERRAVDEALAEALGLPPMLRQLRDWLGGHLDDPSVATAARALGLSPRSLQRHL